MVRFSELEIPPAGAGFATVIDNVPTTAISLARTCATN